MSSNTELKVIKSSNEWFNLIDEADYFKSYEFSNIQEIGSGSIGIVYRTNWKISHINYYLALKSFYNLDNITAKEIVNEVIYIMYNNFTLVTYIFLIFIDNLA
jgi:hypothetical protein